MSDPTFWNDADKAREISQKATEAKDAYETYTNLFQRAESLKDILDLAIEEDDQEMEPEIAEELAEVKAILDKKEIELLLSGHYHVPCRCRRYGSSGLDRDAHKNVYQMG